ncbi:MAG: L,D-transpeptidase [Mojavia pulchra JT2-VF2]|jgi:lipoprotein-anchoring transpeptidase ErfK/SrfK|uniref:L,D-transpeptidase n=1 Tax=Mojavia pulchra JT2-VF2 TaxID=287848 RepID=A0A951UJ85_9NOST|nr:L,D-transpeptidase [Mojavia pulchra JT2-VF2]
MVRNESVARIVMLLCFGTAILSLAVHWRINSTQQQFKQLASSKDSRKNDVYSISKGNLGATAYGASVSNEPMPRKSTSKLSATKRHNTKSRIKAKNVAKVTDEPKKTRLLVQEKQQNLAASIWPQSLLPKALAQQNLFNNNKYSDRQVVVDLSDRRAYVYRSDVVIASYPIAVGKKGWETPTGNFQVMYKQHDPIWRHPITDQVFEPGPDSPLGERWISFWSDGHNQIGFHGTPNTEVMGTAISHGCLRMRNPDVRLLYEQVKVGTPVIVRE